MRDDKDRWHSWSRNLSLICLLAPSHFVVAQRMHYASMFSLKTKDDPLLQINVSTFDEDKVERDVRDFLLRTFRNDSTDSIVYGSDPEQAVEECVECLKKQPSVK
jgi:hypothetical protein